MEQNETTVELRSYRKNRLLAMLVILIAGAILYLTGITFWFLSIPCLILVFALMFYVEWTIEKEGAETVEMFDGVLKKQADRNIAMADSIDPTIRSRGR